MTDTIFLSGVIATPPRHTTTDAGLSITSFRLASSQRRFDRVSSQWVDGDTNWYTVTAFRHLADNAQVSLAKGDRVLLSGRLRVRSWENGERSGTSVEIDADSLGHDLLWGTTVVTRIPPAKSAGPVRGETTAPREATASLDPEDPDGDSDGQLAPEGEWHREPVAAPF